MNSESIKQIAPALLKAQSQMSNPKKGSNNPFFKSKYADLNSVREACLPALNENGISVIQPICCIDGKNYVETILLHESGEWISSLTEIICNKSNDAQSFGSGSSYSRRYGLQSLIFLGADDDDANNATGKSNWTEEVNKCNSIEELTKLWAKIPENIKPNLTVLFSTKKSQLNDSTNKK
jgi:hypothetical protein